MSAYQGNGIFTISGTGLPYVTGTTISSTVQNNLNSDLATGLSTALCKDGQSTPTANLKMGGFKFTNLGNGTAATDSVAYGQLTTALGSLQGFIGGLTLSTAGSSGTFGITAGTASDSTNVTLLALASAFTKTTSAFAAGTGNGSLDTGSIANTTWYHVFAIGPSTDILISLSPTAPTLPGAYTYFRRIGSMKTDISAHWVKFLQLGNEFLLDIPIEDYLSQTISASTAITLTLSVPTGIKVSALGQIRTTYNSVNSYFILSSFDVTDTAPTSSLFGWNVQSGAVAQYPPFNTRTNTSAQIRFRGTNGAGSASDAAYNVFTTGWIDTRGQG